jgi:hypothetical protein
MQPVDSEYQGEKDTEYCYELLRCYDSRLLETDRMPNVYWLIDLATGGPKECSNCSTLPNGETDHRKHGVNLKLIQDDPTRYPLNFGRDEKYARRERKDEHEEFHEGSTEDDGKQAGMETSRLCVESEKFTSFQAGQGESDEE